MLLHTDQNHAERGVILLTAMLMVAAMSAVAVAVMDDIRFGLRRATNVALYNQAYWYGLGAETLSRRVIFRDWDRDNTRSTRNDLWAQQGVRFPIEGGVIEGVISDGSNCFNLNSVVSAEDAGAYARNKAGADRFYRLLTALDIDAAGAGALTEALVDWIDADDAPGLNGAEDYDYSIAKPPYRTGAALLADISELRAISGFSSEIYRVIAPHVCVLPTTRANILNINTLLERNAPLLVALAGNDLNVSQAEEIIAARPVDGYDDVEVFWGQDGLNQINIEEDVKALTGLLTRYYSLAARVVYNGAYFELHSQLELTGAGQVNVVSRRFGALD